MSSVWLRATNVFAALVRNVRVRPIRTTIAGGLTLLLLAAVGSYSYAVYGWRKAHALCKARQYDAALQQVSFGQRLWADDLQYLIFAAKLHRLTGELDSAEAKLNRFFTLAKGNHVDQVLRGDAQIEYLQFRVQTGDDEAVEPLFKLVNQRESAPECAEILETISVSYIRKLRYQAANGCLTRWIELFPDQALPYDYRGWVFEKTSSPSLAYQDYKKALELDPSLILVRLRLVELLLQEKKVPEVGPHLAILQQQEPERIEVKARLGMLKFLEGDSTAARRLLEDVEPRLSKKDVIPLVYLARLDVQEGRGAEAEQRLRRVMDIDPTESDARFVMISALQLQGKDQEAAAMEKEQQAIRFKNERVNLLLRDRADKPDATVGEWFEIGSIFLGFQMENRGLYWLDKVLARDPNHQDTHRVLMEYFERKGEITKAQEHRRMLRAPPPSRSP